MQYGTSQDVFVSLQSNFMKKIILILLLMHGLSPVLLAQKNLKGKENVVSEATETLDSLILTETEYNFGKIPQGKPVTHIFEVVNGGKAAFKIGNVQASCGCTTPDWERDKDIPAGAITKITVGYNAASEGAFTKNITISYGKEQTKQLIIMGEVWKTPSTSAPENKELNELKN